MRILYHAPRNFHLTQLWDAILFNVGHNRIRQVVERTIAHIKSWRILHTPYRRPLETFEQTITAALALYAFKTALRI